jgi:hypothetical protein
VKPPETAITALNLDSRDRVVDALKDVAARHGASPARVALAWLLGRPAVSSVIVAARKPEHLEDNIPAVAYRFVLLLTSVMIVCRLGCMASAACFRPGSCFGVRRLVAAFSRRNSVRRHPAGRVRGGKSGSELPRSETSLGRRTA